MTVPVSGVSKKPLLEVGFRGEGSEQGLDSRRSPAAWLEIDTPALGPGDRSPAPSSLLPMRTALLGDFFFFFYLFFSFFFPRPPVSSLSLWLEGGVCSCARPTGTASEERGKKKEVSLLKKKKKKSLMEALFYQRYQNLNCTRASVRPSPPSSAPSLRRVSGFQSESCCVCSAPAPLFLVLKRERIPFLNQRPDAQGWEDLGGEGGGE